MADSMHGLAPWLQPAAEYLVYYAGAQGWNPRVTSIYRSPALQARLWRAYLSGQSRFPAAPPGQSWHQYHRAFDLVTTPMSKLTELGALWHRMGGSWWPSDPIHFQA